MTLCRFEGLLKTAEVAYGEGRFEASLAAATEAEEIALRLGRQDLADRASCNRCPALIELDRLHGHMPELRRILLRSSESRTRWMAAYYSAVGHDLEDQREQALGYARRALDLVECAEEPASAGATANLLGNLSLRECNFVEAEGAYRRSLASYEQLGGLHRVMQELVRDNLGYVLMCTDRVREGIDLCERSVEGLEELAAAHHLHQPLQDLCYGYLLDGGLDLAQAAGERGLELALEDRDRLVVKNLMFLLAEVSVRSGDRFRARRYLRELAQYYPELDISEELIDVLMATDFTRAVNLRGS